MTPAADRRIRVHVKNNHASPDTFPPTLEGEAVFTITQERFDIAAQKHAVRARRNLQHTGRVIAFPGIATAGMKKFEVDPIPLPVASCEALTGQPGAFRAFSDIDPGDREYP